MLDIFKFHNPTDEMRMIQGEIVNGLSTKLWVEKYREPGEFKFTSRYIEKMRDLLPIDTFVSHINTGEIMIVENHEITEDDDQPKEIVITGRSFETILDRRVVGDTNASYPVVTIPGDFGWGITYAADYTGNQIVEMIRDHIYAARVGMSDNAIPYTVVQASNVNAGAQENATIEPGDLYEAVVDWLEEDNLGIKAIRPGEFSPLATDDTALIIYKGNDLTATVHFSYMPEDISQAEYLWSRKDYKNAAYVAGTWVITLYDPLSRDGLKRRVLFIDGRDIDSGRDTMPDITQRNNISDRMKKRAKRALGKHNSVILSRAELSQSADLFQYRSDYYLGDTVMVLGEYDQAAMIVTEHAEIEDEDEYQAYPTLTLIDEGV